MSDDKIWKAVDAGDEAELKALGSGPVSKEALLYKGEVRLENPTDGCMQLMLTPLQAACAKGNTEIVTLLLSMGFTEEQLLATCVTCSGFDSTKIAVMFAAMTDHAETVKALLAAGFLQEQLLAQEDQGRTALIFAAMHGAATVEAVLGGGFLAEQLAAVDGEGMTALMHAASRHWLFDNGAAVGVILEAARTTFEGDAFPEYLLKGSGRHKGHRGSTALMLAALSGSDSLVTAVIAGGHVAEQISAQDYCKMTALMYAATCFDTSSTVEAVLGAGFVEQQTLALDEDHMNALMHVAKQGRTASVQKLLCEGYASKQLAGDRKTAIQVAEDTCRNDMVETLKQATEALEWAEKRGDDVATCLKEALSNPAAFKAKMSAEIPES